ncbi:MAG: quinolinate synthase NadA [Ruminococcaceae bacterium]|nr:quinolinate synthase NadA [Oscillospiraceae bacterium]
MKNRIIDLKKEKNAVILAHYYAPIEAQDVADYIGDSFYLAKIAKESTADIIVFCGVSFMGESAKILNPDKKVLMPDPKADCPMAHMVKDGLIEKMRKEYEDLAVVCYINSTAELKSHCDVCVTSSNAVGIVKKLKNKNIFFIPDKNLGSFVAKQIPEKNIILNDGFCPIHASISASELLSCKAAYPNALVLSHPECEKEILDVSDFVGSTADIINYAKSSLNKEFIICTEDGVEYKLTSDNRDKKFYFPDPRPRCTDMKLNNLENILSVLQNEDREITIPEEIRQKALAPLDKMLELAK